MHARWLILLSLCGCATQPAPQPAAAESAHAAPAAAEREAEPPVEPAARAAPPTAQELVGTWARYWSMSGTLDTDRYVFGADGRFAYHAAGSHEATLDGEYLVEGQQLVLRASDGSEPRRLSLGACPPNEEARRLDDAYRCIAIDDRAFWH